MTFNLLFVVTLLAGLLALFDGISRLRGRRANSIVAIAEIVFAVLMLISLFVAFPAPLGLLTWAILLLITLVLILVLRSPGGRVWIVTVVAFALTVIVVLVTLGWLRIPGLF
jgi:hypothetical protein